MMKLKVSFFVSEALLYKVLHKTRLSTMFWCKKLNGWIIKGKSKAVFGHPFDVLICKYDDRSPNFVKVNWKYWRYFTIHKKISIFLRFLWTEKATKTCLFGEVRNFPIQNSKLNNPIDHERQLNISTRP